METVELVFPCGQKCSYDKQSLNDFGYFKNMFEEYSDITSHNYFYSKAGFDLIFEAYTLIKNNNTLFSLNKRCQKYEDLKDNDPVWDNYTSIDKKFKKIIFNLEFEKSGFEGDVFKINKKEYHELRDKLYTTTNDIIGNCIVQIEYLQSPEYVYSFFLYFYHNSFPQWNYFTGDRTDADKDLIEEEKKLHMEKFFKPQYKRFDKILKYDFKNVFSQDFFDRVTKEYGIFRIPSFVNDHYNSLLDEAKDLYTWLYNQKIMDKFSTAKKNIYYFVSRNKLYMTKKYNNETKKQEIPADQVQNLNKFFSDVLVKMDQLDKFESEMLLIDSSKKLDKALSTEYNQKLDEFINFK